MDCPARGGARGAEEQRGARSARRLVPRGHGLGRAFAAAHLPALITSTGDNLLLPCGIAAPSSLSSVCPPPSPSLRHFFQPAPGPRTPAWAAATTDPRPQSFPSLPHGSVRPLGTGVRAATHREGQQELPAKGSARGACGSRCRHGRTRRQVAGRGTRKAGVGRRSRAKGRGPGAGWAGRAGVRGRERGARRELLFFSVFLKLLRLTPGAFPLTEGGVPGASETHRSAPPWYFLKSLFLEERQQVGTPSRRHPFSVLGVSHRRTPPICPISPPPRYPP